MEQEKIESTATELIDAVRVIFEAELAKETDAAPILSRALALMPDLHLLAERPGPRRQSVCQHLSRALELGETGPAAPVAKAIRTLGDSLHWRQNPKYTVETKGAPFMENYAFTDFGIGGSSAIYLGVVLLGPDTTYPPTAYAGSEGVFLVIGGSPEWKCGDDPWQCVAAGDIIARPLNGSEGKRTLDEPMLALYAWIYP